MAVRRECSAPSQREREKLTRSDAYFSQGFKGKLEFIMRKEWEDGKDNSGSE